ncbi:MAG TPA: DUF1552 domain-containing protein [Bryobacteraceae bacterium]|nr:DUF1552 domain-containing protein [Bryobacteraceae bacterium]
MTVALPLLDAMTPAFAATTRIAAKPPLRMAFCYVPNGIIMQDWTPAAVGTNFDLPKTLEPLAAYRNDFSILSGLAQHQGFALGDGAGDHARAAATFLTGVHPKKTAGADICAGVSADQVAAQFVGKATKFPSLELGCEDGRVVGNCDSGYSCAYSNSISWRTPSTPMPPEINPRAVFERLFGSDSGEDPAVRARQRIYNSSILDYVMADTKQLEGELGPTDRRKLDEYLSAVREIEGRIQKAERENKEIVPNMDKPAGVPVDFNEHARLMFDLTTLAFQNDLTRISSFMFGREGSTRTYREINIPDAHHPLTHHRGNPDMIAKVQRINVFHLQQFAYFLGKLKAIKEGDGSLLDHTVIVYGSGLSDGNRHQHNNLPVLLAGGACGTIRNGRHLQYAQDTPLTDLFLALLDRMGVQEDHLGDSNGELNHLTDLT